MKAPDFRPPGRNLVIDPPALGSACLIAVPNPQRTDWVFYVWYYGNEDSLRCQARWLRNPAGQPDSMALWWPLPQQVA